MTDRAAGQAPPPDAAARERIETDIGTTLFVEAGAGSGKTESLVRRIAAIFGGGSADPRNLAAVTFTRKAAAELRQRLQVRLEELAVTETEPVCRQRYRDAATGLGEAFVGTIHAFCGRLLREHPFEAGLDPEFTELEEDEAARLREEAWQEYLARLQAARPDLPALLDDLGVTADDLHAIFVQLSLYPEVPPVSAAAPRPEPDRDALEALLKSLRQLFPGGRPERGWDSLQQAVQRCERLLALGDEGIRRRLFTAYESLAKNLENGVVLNRWASQDDGRVARELYTAFRSERVEPLLTAWREYRHRPLLDLVAPAVAFAAERRRAAAQVDYTDLLLGTARLLREHPPVRKRLSRRFTHVLVDEFQDTDPLQAEVMFLLTGTPELETDWRRLGPRSGSLFVVGDPKQSIYRFRRADIAIYQEVKDLIRAAGGAVVRLEANFRSLPAVAEWVSGAFQPILPAADIRHQAAFAPLLAVRPAAGGLGAGVRRLTIPKVPGNRAEEMIRCDAQRIAGWIAWACAGSVVLARSPSEVAAGVPTTAQPGDFLILLPYKDRLGIYAAALEDAGLPVEVSGGSSLAESEHVGALLQVLTSLADPEDPVALLACLRGPCCGLSDAELYRFRAAGGRLSYLAPQDDPGQVGQALTRLNGYWRWARRLPPAAAVERIVEDLGLLPLAAGGPLGGSASGALLAALDLVRAQAAQAPSFAAAVAGLAASLDAGEHDAVSLVPNDVRAVRLMNLHKAKGLEAPVVFLAGPTRKRQFPPTVHVDRRGSRPEGYFLFRRPGRAGVVIAQPAGWAQKADEEVRFEAAEDERLLYVAATRARDLLVVSRYAGAPDGDPWAALAPALETAAELEDMAPPVVRRPALALARDELDAAVARTADAVHTAAGAGFRHLAVTDLVRDLPLPPSEWGDGASWGRAVHRLLAAACGGLPRADWDRYAAQALVDEGRTAGEVDRIVGVVGGVWESTLGQRVQRAQQVLVEVPFGQSLPAAALGWDDGPVRVLMEGVIDLAFLEPEGWVLVDFKTDASASEDPGLLAAHYSPQLRAYVEFWRDALAAPVKQALFFFTAPMLSVDLPPT